QPLQQASGRLFDRSFCDPVVVRQCGWIVQGYRYIGIKVYKYISIYVGYGGIGDREYVVLIQSKLTRLLSLTFPFSHAPIHSHAPYTFKPLNLYTLYTLYTFIPLYPYTLSTYIPIHLYTYIPIYLY